jgi:type III secretion system HrpE/YscL family protein
MMDRPARHFRSIVRADMLRLHADANMIVADAKAEASRIRAELELDRIKAFEEARRQGFSQGVAEAAAIAANAVKAVEEFWREREGEVAEIAFAIAHRIVGNLPADQRLAQIVSMAISEYSSSVQLTLRTTPEAAGHLRAFLKNAVGAERVTVVADPAAAPGECTLYQAHGRTDLGLLAQFRAMMNGLADPRAETERRE